MTMGLKDMMAFDHGRRERLQKALSIYLQKSSVSGVSFIIGTKYAVVRTIWTILLVVALMGMTVHLTLLFSQYTAYDKQSSTDLHFSILPLPAVTFCNVNPIRKSQIHLASSNLERLITSFDPKRIGEVTNEFNRKRGNRSESSSGGKDGDVEGTRFNTTQSTTTDYDDGDLFGDFDLDSFLLTKWNDPRSQDSGDGRDVDSNGKKGGATNRGGGKTSSRGRSGREVRHYQEKKDSGPKKSRGTKSTFKKINSLFRTLYGAEPRNIRAKMGHRLNTLLINCDIADTKCLTRHFMRVSSNVYGNCFTLQQDDLLIDNDGPLSGLDVILYLQGEEYIKGFTPSQGIQVVVHEPGTFPFPEDEGFSVAAGTHTMVGLKMQDVSRLGTPHGDCSDVDDFKEKYGTAYTRQTCQKLCETASVVAKCGCIDFRSLHVSKLLNFTEDVRPCRSDTEHHCAKHVQLEMNKEGKRSCFCKNPCKEKKYVKTISSRPWPNDDYAKIFVANVCAKQNVSKSECDALNDKQGYELRQEFLKLSVYYEDLNYEKLSEIPSYKLVQLLCDVGGSIGLWIGLSLLSLCEILHLIGNLFVAVCCNGFKKRFQKEKEEKGEKDLSEIPLS